MERDTLRDLAGLIVLIGVVGAAHIWAGLLA